MKEVQMVELHYTGDEGPVWFRVELSAESIAKVIPFMEKLAEEDEEEDEG